MSAVTSPAHHREPPSVDTPSVDIVIPVYNEQNDLASSVRRLDDQLARSFPYPYRITIADNASTDSTWQIAQELSDELPSVSGVHLPLKGRGRALKKVWLDSSADVVAYMDVDMSTDLKAFFPLIAPLISGHSDVAIGSRLARGSRVQRGPKRELISRGYNLLLHAGLRTKFSDAQCGFKAVRRDVAQRLLPLVEDDNWFFDTELLVLAERAGLRIHEVPVDWVDDPSSTVDIVATAKEDILGMVRVSRNLSSGRIPVDDIHRELGSSGPAAGVSTVLWGQMLRFGLVGVASTIAYLALYLALRLVWGPQVGNLVALLVTAVLNTAVNRRITFGVTGRKNMVSHHVGGLVAFLLALGLTSGSLWLLHAAFPAAGWGIETVVLVIANAAATLLRFLSLRWVMAHGLTR